MARRNAVARPFRNSAEIARRFRVLDGGRGIVHQQWIEIRGHRGILVIERIATSVLRASVAVHGATGVYALVSTLDCELGEEAHRLARAALEQRGAIPTRVGAWSVAWTVDGREQG